MSTTGPVAPRPPSLIAVDPAAAEEAVAILRGAAEAAALERDRQVGAIGRAAEAWIGRERERAERDAAGLARAWSELEVDLRRAATDVRLAVAGAVHENRVRQAAYEDALAEYREGTAARARTEVTGR